MALGKRLFGGLLTTNAIVTVEAPTVTVTGGVTVVWAEVVCGVDVLITQLDGGRNPEAGGDFQNDTHTVSGVDTELARTDIRLLVTTCDDLPDLEGKYLRVNDSVRHPRGRGGRRGARITLRCSRIQVSANQI